MPNTEVFYLKGFEIMEHCFNMGIAKMYGTDAAILLGNLLNIIGPEAEEGFEADERYNYELRFNNSGIWVKISVAEWIEIMPYMSKRKIRKAVKLLSENGVIRVSQLSKNEFDGTNWYSITKKGIKLIIENREETRA